MENVIVVGLGVISAVVAVFVSWKWRNIPLRNPRPVGTEGDRFGRLRIAARTVGAVSTAGIISGLFVLGLVGRLVMRILAATSSDAQGKLTEADEIVGEITFGGTLGFLLFVGLLGGLICIVVYLFVRVWMPAQAGMAGLVMGTIVTGTLGVADALSPNNGDFAILTPLWLAILLLVGTGFLFATTFTALAARLDLFAQTPGRARSLLYPGLVMSLAVPPIGIATVAHVLVRTFFAPQLATFTQSGRTRKIGRTLLAAGTAVSAAFIVSAAAQIFSA
ncbi:MAG: hypothetical protein ABIQ38_06595 [Ilumatobacteraceae bacterium]